MYLWGTFVLEFIFLYQIVFKSLVMNNDRKILEYLQTFQDILHPSEESFCHNYLKQF